MKKIVRECNIVQIVDQADPWYPALLIVSSIHPWGVQACAYVPETNQAGAKASEAYKRLTWEQFDVVGDARIVPFGEPKVEGPPS